MQPVRARVLHGEAVGEVRAWLDGVLGQVRYAVHVAAHPDTVRVQCRRHAQMVGEREIEDVAGGDPDLLAGQCVAVRP
jgi:hypothetical protein